MDPALCWDEDVLFYLNYCPRGSKCYVCKEQIKKKNLRIGINVNEHWGINYFHFNCFWRRGWYRKQLVRFDPNNVLDADEASDVYKGICDFNKVRPNDQERFRTALRKYIETSTDSKPPNADDKSENEAGTAAGKSDEGASASKDETLQEKTNKPEIGPLVTISRNNPGRVTIYQRNSRNEMSLSDAQWKKLKNEKDEVDGKIKFGDDTIEPAAKKPKTSTKGKDYIN